MRKKAILTCGYFSLNSVNELLYKEGYEILKMRPMENPQLDEYCVDEFDRHEECINVEADNYLRGETGKELSQEDQNAIALFGAGGVQYANEYIFLHMICNKFFGSLVSINATYDYFIDVCKRFDVKAVLVHTAEGPVWGSLVWSAKKFGVPTFCCYNGTLANYISDYSAHRFYNVADFYYLHGGYDISWMNRRTQSEYKPETMPMVGQPSFDLYYDNSGNIKKPEVDTDDVFLYGNVVVYTSFDIPPKKIKVSLDMVDYAYYRSYIPTNLDASFFTAFSAYQKKVNPNAKLVVPLRPYFNMRSSAYQKYISGFGIKNVKVYNHEEIPFRALVKNVKYVVSGASTLLIEALLNRKSILCLTGNSDVVPFEFIKDWAVVSSTSNTEVLVENIVKMTESEDRLIQGCDEYATYFNYGDDGKAGERMAEDMVMRIR